MPKPKKKRVGTITCAIKYVVDIDDAGMIEQAKDCFYEDLYQAIVKTSDRSEFEAMLEVKQDSKLREKDIDQFLQEGAEERRMEELRDEGKLVSCVLCHQEAVKTLAHRHQGEWVCEECWDERLKNME